MLWQMLPAHAAWLPIVHRGFASGRRCLRRDDNCVRDPFDRSLAEAGLNGPFSGIRRFVQPRWIRCLDRGPYHRSLDCDHGRLAGGGRFRRLRDSLNSNGFETRRRKVCTDGLFIMVWRREKR
jgi:hypothetical protein